MLPSLRKRSSFSKQALIDDFLINLDANILFVFLFTLFIAKCLLSLLFFFGFFALRFFLMFLFLRIFFILNLQVVRTMYRYIAYLGSMLRFLQYLVAKRDGLFVLVHFYVAEDGIHECWYLLIIAFLIDLSFWVKSSDILKSPERFWIIFLL